MNKGIKTSQILRLVVGYCTAASVLLCIAGGVWLSVGVEVGAAETDVTNVTRASVENAKEHEYFRQAMTYVKKNNPRSFAREAKKFSASSPYQPMLDYWRGVLALKKGRGQMLLSLHTKSPSAYVRQQAAKELGKHYIRNKQWKLFDGITVTGPCAVLIQQLRARVKSATKDLRLKWYDDLRFNQPLCISAYRLAKQRGILSQKDVWRKLRQLAGARLLVPTRRLMRNFKLPLSYNAVRKVVRHPVTYIKGRHALQTQAQRELVMIAAIAGGRFNLDVTIRRWRAFSKYFTDDLNEQVWAKIGERAARAHRNDALALYARAPSAKSHDGNSRAWHVRAALRAQNYAEVARVINTMPPAESSLTAWRYWQATALNKIGQTAKGTKLLHQLAKDADDYYGLLAREDSSLPLVPHSPNSPLAPYTTLVDSAGNSSDSSDSSVSLNPPKKDKKTKLSTPTASASVLIDYDLALAVWRADRISLARRIWKAAISHTTADAALIASDSAAAAGWHLAAINAANSQPQEPASHQRRFPFPYRDVIDKYSKLFALDRAFVYALIRRESRFMPKAKSSARARGLMQVLPSTARAVARQNKYTNYTLARLTRVDTNVIIGATYLRDLAQRFNNSPIEVAAAYNAGPGRAARWQRNHRDHDALAQIENIPLLETRLYVKAVLAARAHYGARLGSSPKTMRQIIELAMRGDNYPPTAALSSP